MTFSETVSLSVLSMKSRIYSQSVTKTASSLQHSTTAALAIPKHILLRNPNVSLTQSFPWATDLRKDPPSPFTEMLS